MEKSLPRPRSRPIRDLSRLAGGTTGSPSPDHGVVGVSDLSRRLGFGVYLVVMSRFCGFNQRVRPAS
jgi:hypothetical protein